MGLSTLQYLKKVYPEAKITYAVPSWVAPLFESSECAPDEVYPLNLNTMGMVYAFFKFLNQQKFDCVIELHQSGKTSKIFSLLRPWLRFKYFFHNHHNKKLTYIKDQGLAKASIQRDLDGVWSALNKFFDYSDSVPNYLDFPPKINCDHSSAPKPFCILGLVATRETTV